MKRAFLLIFFPGLLQSKSDGIGPLGLVDRSTWDSIMKLIFPHFLVVCLERGKLSKSRSRRGLGPTEGFTLVELLVVIAIIGVLIGLLLPAVQAARESARRTQCSNKVRQIMQASHNLLSAHKIFPSGGVCPWPNIEDYSSGGVPFGPDRQGLCWAYQILPFLEEGAVANLSTTQKLRETPIALYFCPSRRGPTKGPQDDLGWLMDYAALNPILSRGEVGDRVFTAWTADRFAGNGACETKVGFWGTMNGDGNGGMSTVPQSASELGGNFHPFRGVFARGSYAIDKGTKQGKQLGFGGPVKPNMITDGLSKTAAIAEKRLPPSAYKTGAWYDDRGWSDGWDPDAIRSTGCWPAIDGNTYRLPNGTLSGNEAYVAGSAHPSGFQVGFADGSVRNLEYAVELEVFNSMAHRSDGK